MYAIGELKGKRKKSVAIGGDIITETECYRIIGLDWHYLGRGIEFNSARINNLSRHLGNVPGRCTLPAETLLLRMKMLREQTVDFNNGLARFTLSFTDSLSINRI